MNHLNSIPTPIPKSILLSHFDNGELTDLVRWLDSDGNLINAHDGGILFWEGCYYWYGLALRPDSVAKGGQKTTKGVVMYSSPDLYNWSYEGVILECVNEPGHPLCGPMRFERPKIVYNDRTGRFVLWTHYVANPGDHGESAGMGEAGVASCDTINGKYEWHGTCRPIDERGVVRDSTLYKDDNGSAYFIYDRDICTPGPDFSRILHIVKLSDDYLSPTAQWRRIDVAARREAPIIIKRDGYYFLITSGLTGWDFNSAQYFRATNIFGPYEDMGDPCVEELAELTYNSQGTHAFQLKDQSNKWILMLERHHTPCMTDSSYLFLPVEFRPPGTLQVPYRKDWKWEEELISNTEKGSVCINVSLPSVTRA